MTTRWWVRYGWFAPLGLLALCSAILASRSEAPERLSLDRQWASPTLQRPFGSGEGGIDLATFVGHSCLRVLGLSVAVATLACLLGVPVGAWAATKGGRFELILLRTCDLVQSFPTFLDQ